MPSDDLLTPVRRDGLLAVLALVLLAAPLWAPSLHLGDPTYRYERAEVVINDTSIEYANETGVPYETPISDDVACSSGWEVRACAFERLLVENRTIPTRVYSSNPNDETRRWSSFEDRYHSVLLNDTVYRVTYVTNSSAPRSDGMYRVDMSLEPASPERVLEHVSMRAESDDVPPVVAEAARSGEAQAPREVAVPDTPIRLDDGTYYRVYRVRWSDDPSPIARALDFFLTYVAPLVGLSLIARLSENVEVTYVGED